MYSPNVIVYSIATLSFIISFAGFYILSLRNEEFAPQKNTPFLVFLPTIIMSFVALYLLLPTQEDFLYPWNIEQIIIPLVGGGIIYCSSRFLNSTKLHLFITLICTGIFCFFMPEEFSIIPQMPPILSKIILGLCLFSFSYFYPISNNIDTLTGIQTLSICLGIYLLALIGGTPILLGALALSLGSICMSFLAFNRYPAQLSFIPAGCQALGFITGCLMLQAVNEGSSSAILIFSLFFWVELISAILRKAINWRQKLKLNTYTNCYQANLSGFPPYTIGGHVLRLQLVLILMGCFAIYAPEGATVPILSLITTIWYISKIKNWQNANKTIRELNNDLMNNIKNNINNIKDQINKDK